VDKIGRPVKGKGGSRGTTRAGGAYSKTLRLRVKGLRSRLRLKEGRWSKYLYGQSHQRRTLIRTYRGDEPPRPFGSSRPQEREVGE
jgi:hypothetical protein